MAEWVIHKWSRSASNVSYNGPACEAAGIIGGQVYTDRATAEADAARLTQVNPVGFHVSERPVVYHVTTRALGGDDAPEHRYSRTFSSLVAAAEWVNEHCYVVTPDIIIIPRLGWKITSSSRKESFYADQVQHHR